MKHVRTTCPLDCPDACGVLVETTDAGEFVSLRGNPEHPWSRGSLCGKTSLYGELVRSDERLVRPLVRDGGVLRPSTWEAALDRIAERTRGLAGERILALEYAGNMGRVARRFPGRVMNALDAVRHDGGVCDNTGTVGYQAVLGSVLGAGLETVEDCDLLLLWGVDVARTVQHLQPAIQRLCRRGTPVVAIDVYRSDTLRRLERWGGRGVVIRGGSDAALALALARMAFETERADRAYLAREATGVERFEAHVRGAHDVAWAEEVCGLTPGELEELARAVFAARRPFVKVGVGWTRRRNGAHGMRAVCSLAAVLGCADRLHYESGDHFDVDNDVIERPELRSAPAVLAPQVGLGARLDAGEFGAVFVWGHNPVVTLPDAERVRRGLARADTFTVVHEQFLTETCEVADVVLPAATFVEQTDVYTSYGHRVLQFGRAACLPPGEARGNLDAFAAIARRLELPRETWDVSAESLCAELLEAHRGRLDDARWAALLAGEPVELPPRVARDRGTPSGRIELASDALEPPVASFVSDEDAGAGPRERGAFSLHCAPSRATHNSTYLSSPRHLAKLGPPRVHVHPADAAELGVGDGDALRLENARGAVTLEVAVGDEGPRGQLRVDGMFRARDVPERVGINALVTPATSDLAHGNSLYSTRVDARRADGGA